MNTSVIGIQTGDVSMHSQELGFGASEDSKGLAGDDFLKPEPELESSAQDYIKRQLDELRRSTGSGDIQDLMHGGVFEDSLGGLWTVVNIKDRNIDPDGYWVSYSRPGEESSRFWLKIEDIIKSPEHADDRYNTTLFIDNTGGIIAQYPDMNYLNHTAVTVTIVGGKAEELRLFHDLGKPIPRTQPRDELEPPGSRGGDFTLAVGGAALLVA